MRNFVVFMLGCISFAATGIARAIGYVARLAADIFGPASPAFELFSPPRTIMTADGPAGIDPALYQTNRHEAGVSKRAAQRNT